MFGLILFNPTYKYDRRAVWVSKPRITMKRFTLFYLFLIVSLCGCLGSMQKTQPAEETAASSETAAPSTLTELQLSTPNPSYSAQEAVPLELKIQNGKFDLLVPFSSVAAQSAFIGLKVENANGEVIRPKRTIKRENSIKTLFHKGQSVRCILGFEMKADAIHVVSLEDMQQHYQLPPGKYTVAVNIELEVYRESLPDQHPQVIELEREIQGIKDNKDARYTPEVRQEAIGDTREQIKYIQEKYKDKLLGIYLPIKSRRGKTLLSSNSISLTLK